MPEAITYNLIPDQSPGDFYRDLSHFTNLTLESGFVQLGSYVDDYHNYVVQHSVELVRTKQEYFLELIIIGILVKNYYSKATRTSPFSTALLCKLYSMRKKYQRAKPLIDKVRGVFSYALLEKHADPSFRWTRKGFHQLLNWLKATGEFNEEVLRLQQWASFFKRKTESEAQSWLTDILLFAGQFETKGEEHLGKYLCNVNHFLRNKLKDYRYKEDYFFVSRCRNEYFMNMFGAEILNRQMQTEFKAMPHKAVLLPTCMRTIPQKGCGARHDGKELVCMQCSRNCNVGKIATVMKKHKVKSYLIPHSSGFSKFLRKWENSKDTGLIGVTCILNLLTGGYEMKRLNISSQCIFLDYCACQKHWDKTGYATTLNTNELIRLIS
jgi:uncharacterized protein